LASLEDRMRESPLLAAAVLDRSKPNREIARIFDIDESVVRRWRNKNIVDPEPQTVARDVKVNQTVQWYPGLDLSTDRGEARTLPVPVTEGVTPDDVELLESVGADPDKWEIVGRKESRWQSASGEWLSAHKLELGRRGAQTGDLSVDQISDILSDYTRRESVVERDWREGSTHANGIFVVPIADLQAGKIDGGGTAALVDRFGRIVQEVSERLEREGGCDLLVIPVLGDCIEGLVSQGGKLVTRLDISITEQVRVYRRLLTHIIAELSPYARRVIVPVLPGNHDETYRVVQTPVTDSWAIEGASAVADAMADNPKYQHVKFVFPETEELVITLNVGTMSKPYVLAFTHGHLAKAPNSMENWWGKQSFGRQQAGNADMLFTGHFHHLRLEQMGTGRTWIQCPALDGGSDWFRRIDGADATSGMLSMWVTPGKGLGWEGMTVHSGE
jgi:hypothetical protein